MVVLITTLVSALIGFEHNATGRIDQIARALARVEPSQLADGKLFDFLSLGLREDAPQAQVHADGQRQVG